MFRHKKTANQPVENKIVDEEKKTNLIEQPTVLEKKTTPKTDTETIKELLEKNLKWSQIIYEQNRKINNKLMWSTITSWLRVLIILVPLIWAAWFLPPLIQDFKNNYGSLLSGKVAPNQSSSIEQLLKILPLDPAKQEQLKVLLK